MSISHKIFATILLALCLIGCDSKPTKPSATGSVYECLVVMNEAGWKVMGDAVVDTLEADMPCMPQMEKTLVVSRVPFSAFDQMLMPVRNILLIDVDANQYTHKAVSYARDKYAHPQVVCKVQCTSVDSLLALWKEQGAEIRNFFVREELKRAAEFYKAGRNKEACKRAKEKFGISICIPEDYMLIRDTTDVLWCCNSKGGIRRDLLIWSRPYTSIDEFSYEKMLLARDAVVAEQVEGGMEGSYMTTERNIFPPKLRAIERNGHYTAELRGLWKMHGMAMGGPFVEHAWVDSTGQRIITAELFIYAAGMKKRTAYRQAEAILYTIDK